MRLLRMCWPPAVLALILAAEVLLSAPGIGQSQGTTHGQGQGFAPVKVINPLDEPVPVTGSIHLDSSPTTPVLVLDLDRPARQPFQVELSINVPTGSQGEIFGFSVPARKRLVVEHVSILLQLDSGGKPFARIGSIAGGVGAGYHIPLTAEGLVFGQEGFSASQPIRIYADPESGVGLVISLDALGEPEAHVIGTAAVSGHLVDCGPGPGCPLP